MKKKLRILSVSAEVAPYAKTGGLADVASALPKELASQGHQVALIMPFYNFMKAQQIATISAMSAFRVSVGKSSYSAKIIKAEFSPNISIFFVCNHELFGKHSRLYGYKDDNQRFIFFNKAVFKFITNHSFKPNLIHCHDWHSGLIPNYIKRGAKNDPALRSIATVYTIHNLPFQSGTDWWKIPAKKKDDGRGAPSEKSDEIQYINFAKRAILNADIINTVSERYAEEILTPYFGQELDYYLRRRKADVYGIVNGIDYTVYNPVYDKNISANYDWNQLDKKKTNKLALQKRVGLDTKADAPLIGMVNRLSEQKGFDLVQKLAPVLMKMQLQLVVVGSGHREYVSFFKKLARKYPKRVGFYSPFTEELGSLVYAGSDMFLMPSRYEPCGVSQMISLRYGSVPIVRETGGLSDTITNFNPKTHKGIGFVFSSYTKEGLLIAITRALETYKYQRTWEHLTWRAMKTSYSWEVPAKKYVLLYRLALKRLRKRKGIKTK
ncbi:MAG: glycogen synthase [bacterium]